MEITDGRHAVAVSNHAETKKHLRHDGTIGNNLEITYESIDPNYSANSDKNANKDFC